MKLQDLRHIIEEAYIEVLLEAAEEPATGPKRDQTDPTLDILQKFPTLQKTLTHLLTSQYMEFVEKVGWMSLKPSTFKVEFKSGQDMTLKWMGKNFEANIEGKRYYLANLPEFQQALDKIGMMLAHGPIQTGMDALGGEEGAGGDVFAGAGAPEPAAGAEAEAGAEAGAETPATPAAGEEDVFAGL